jgi:hypothetical protein
LRLITELAVYEKEPDAVKATPELVRNPIHSVKTMKTEDSTVLTLTAQEQYL